MCPPTQSDGLCRPVAVLASEHFRHWLPQRPVGKVSYLPLAIALVPLFYVCQRVRVCDANLDHSIPFTRSNIGRIPEHHNGPCLGLRANEVNNGMTAVVVGCAIVIDQIMLLRFFQQEHASNSRLK